MSLGVNDGFVSTASLVVGVAAADSGRPEILIAGLVAGAMSIAVGEYVSASSQTDAEQADIAREIKELKETPEAELDELTRMYEVVAFQRCTGQRLRAGRHPGLRGQSFRQQQQRRHAVGSRAFIYDNQTDRFTCPAGQVLERKQVMNKDRCVLYTAQPGDCAVCPAPVGTPDRRAAHQDQ